MKQRPKIKRRQVDGVLLLDKPVNISSNDILQKVKGIYRAEKAGHTGALDPLATGLLPICFGESTKLSGLLLDGKKSYLTVAKLGEVTDTSDAEGEIISTRPVDVTLEEVEAVVAVFIGKQEQSPSLFSALKYNGKPLYYYARKGIEVEKKVREIEITNIEIVNFESPFLTLQIDCSKGTYIRTLVEDIGEMLGCGAHVDQLRRNGILGYKEDQAVTFATLQGLADDEQIDKLDSYLLAVDSPAQELLRLDLSDQVTKDLCHGRFINVKDLSDNQLSEDQLVIVYNSTVGYIGIAKFSDGLLRPYRLHSKTAEIITQLTESIAAKLS